MKHIPVGLLCFAVKQYYLQNNPPRIIFKDYFVIEIVAYTVSKMNNYVFKAAGRISNYETRMTTLLAATGILYFILLRG